MDGKYSIVKAFLYTYMKKEILQTSLEQFLKHGIREMSIQKLVAPLGISTKTVYKYFKNKEELLEEALRLFHAQQHQMLENLSAEQNAASLLFDLWYRGVKIEYNVNKAFFQDLHYYYPELGKKIEAAITKKFNQQFLLIIQRGMEEGAFRGDIIPEVVLEGMYVFYRALVRERRFKSFRVSTYDILLNTIAVYIRGFCTASGLRALDEHIRTFPSFEEVTKTRERMPANPS